MAYLSDPSIFQIKTIQPKFINGIYLEAPIGVGLKDFSKMNQIIVEKLISSFDGKSKFEKNNKYAIRDHDGNFIYHVVENTGLENRKTVFRDYKLGIFDSFDNEILSIKRKNKCSLCFFTPCCDNQEINLIKKTTPRNSFCLMESLIYDGKNNLPIYKILFPSSMNHNNDVYFNVINIENNTLASEIIKLSDADCKLKLHNFLLNFKEDISVNLKVLILGAIFYLVNSGF